MTPSSRVLGRMYSTGSSSSSARLQKSMSHSPLACISMTSLPKDDVNSQTDVSCIGYVLPFGKVLSQSILMIVPIRHSQKRKWKLLLGHFSTMIHAVANNGSSVATALSWEVICSHDAFINVLARPSDFSENQCYVAAPRERDWMILWKEKRLCHDVPRSARCSFSTGQSKRLISSCVSVRMMTVDAEEPLERLPLMSMATLAFTDYSKARRAWQYLDRKLKSFATLWCESGHTTERTLVQLLSACRCTIWDSKQFVDLFPWVASVHMTYWKEGGVSSVYKASRYRPNNE